MRTLMLVPLFVCVFAAASFAAEVGGPIVRPAVGDLTGDNRLDVADLELMTHALSEPAPTDIDLYDFDGDGVFDIADARALEEALVGHGTILVSPRGWFAGDVDGSGTVTIADLLRLYLRVIHPRDATYQVIDVAADIDEDGIVGGDDLRLLMSAFGFSF